MINPSIEAQVKVRKKVEEHNIALNEFSAWENNIKEDDANISRRKRNNSIQNLKQAAKNDEKDNTSSLDVNNSIYNDITSQFDKGTISSSALVFRSNKASITNTAVEQPPPASHNPEKKSNQELEEEERQKGNTMFSVGDYHGAINHYSKSVQLNPSSLLAYSNRAMAHLKLKEWQKAEDDASVAIMLDRLHIKSYQRRSTARFALGKIRASLKDLYQAKNILEKYPQNDTMDDVKGQMKVCDIKINQIELELKKIIQNAPKRKVKVKVIRESRKTQSYQMPAIRGRRNKKDVPECSNTRSYALRQKTEASIQKLNSWIHFERFWKSLLHQSEKVDFLRSMKPSKIADIYRNGFEDSDLLLELVLCCSKMDMDGVAYLKAISNIPSVDMVIMMLSNEKQIELSNAVSTVLRCAGDEKNFIRSNLGINVE